MGNWKKLYEYDDRRVISNDGYANLQKKCCSILEFVMERLNHRPRKKLGYRTPYEVFHENLKETILEDKTVALAA